MHSAFRGDQFVKNIMTIHAPTIERCFASVAREVVDVAGEPTEIHRISAADPLMNVIIIPGNPGMSGYYRPYMQHLRESIGSRVQITSITHVGMGSTSSGRARSLTEQIAHKAAFLQEHILKPGQPPCILIGHSIGAYMALAATELVQNPSAEQSPSVPQIKRVMLLFPFLEVDQSSWRQWTIKQFTRIPTPLAAVAAAIGYLPDGLKRSILKLFSGDLNEDAAETTLQLLQFHNARAALHLGSCEFSDLHGPIAHKSWGILERLGKKAVVICAPQDLWHPAQHYQDLVAALPHLDAVMDDRQEHAFCVSDQLSKALAEKIAAKLYG